MATATLVLVLAAGAFAFFHTGARADGLCEERVFVASGELSASHLAVRCEYGLPTHVSYERGLSFVVLVGAAVAWLLTALASATVALARFRG